MKDESSIHRSLGEGGSAASRDAHAPTWTPALRSFSGGGASPSKTRARNFCLTASGRFSRRRRVRPMFTPGSRACGYRTASGRAKWPNRDPIGEAGGINLYGYVFNDPVNEIDPLGLAVGDWYDPRTYWNEGFGEGWSKGGQGVINAFTGGLFWPEYGLFYDTFDNQWKDLGTDGTKDDSAFKFGNNGGRVAVACLAGAGALSRTAIGNANMGWKGGEITFTRPGAPTPDWRINPFGGSGYGPHYHRRGPGGIGRHRPWQPGNGNRF